MNCSRQLSEKERAIIIALLHSTPSALHLTQSLNDLMVKEMKDGGMGSLSLFPKGSEGTSRSFGQQLVLAEFTDTDGVPVSIALNADKDGRLYELDVWKVDFSPLLAWPDTADIRISGGGAR